MPPPFDEQVAQRWFAVECNNRAWDFLEKSQRTADEADEMIHLAHASCWHWQQVGQPINRLRAMCLLANVYTQVGRPHEALRYAVECLNLSSLPVPEQVPFDRATALECVARAHALAGEKAAASRWKAQAGKTAAAIEDAADRQYFEDKLNGGDWYGV